MFVNDDCRNIRIILAEMIINLYKNIGKNQYLYEFEYILSLQK